MNRMLSFDEIGLIPKRQSFIKSRKDVNPFYEEFSSNWLDAKHINKLPIFVAPMTCILNKKNFNLFQKSAVTPIYPIWNGETIRDRFQIAGMGWVSVTLKEFEKYFTSSDRLMRPTNNTPYKILIDCAQGHMKEIYDLVRIAKEHYSDGLIVMIGNIANPEAYYDCCECGVDYVRVGIGGGSGCITSVLDGFHASLPWLLEEIAKCKKTVSLWGLTNKDNIYKTITKVVADGGINTFDKAMKALAMGADYVMMGSMFASCEESGDAVTKTPLYNTYCEADDEDEECEMDDCNIPTLVSRLYYGQASIDGQKDRFGEVRNEPEGITKAVEVNTTLKDLTLKFENVLRSSMSYAGASTLSSFIGKVEYREQSLSEFNNYYK